MAQNAELSNLFNGTFGTGNSGSWADDDDIDLEKLASALPVSKPVAPVSTLSSANSHDSHNYSHGHGFNNTHTGNDWSNRSNFGRVEGSHYDRRRSSNEFNYGYHNNHKTSDYTSSDYNRGYPRNDPIGSRNGYNNGHVGTFNGGGFGGSSAQQWPALGAEPQAAPRASAPRIPAPRVAAPKIAAPRVAPAVVSEPAKPRPNPFGNAKPVDQSKIEHDISAKLQEATKPKSDQVHTELEQPLDPHKPKPNPFGNAKPVDQAKIDLSAVPVSVEPKAESESKPAKPKFNPFGNAKPVDQSKIEADIKEKLAKLSVNSTTFKLGDADDEAQKVLKKPKEHPQIEKKNSADRVARKAPSSSKAKQELNTQSSPQNSKTNAPIRKGSRSKPVSILKRKTSSPSDVEPSSSIPSAEEKNYNEQMEPDTNSEESVTKVKTEATSEKIVTKPSRTEKNTRKPRQRSVPQAKVPKIADGKGVPVKTVEKSPVYDNAPAPEPESISSSKVEGESPSQKSKPVRRKRFEDRKKKNNKSNADGETKQLEKGSDAIVAEVPVEPVTSTSNKPDSSDVRRKFTRGTRGFRGQRPRRGRDGVFHNATYKRVEDTPANKPTETAKD